MDITEFQRRLLEACHQWDEEHGRARLVHAEGRYAGRINVYALARRVDPNPDAAEDIERVIRTWLQERNPTMPSEASRETLALALNLPPDFFVPSPVDPGVREGRRLAEAMLAYTHDRWPVSA